MTATVRERSQRTDGLVPLRSVLWDHSVPTYKRATPYHFLRLPLSQKWCCSCVKAIVRQRYYDERSSCPKFLSVCVSKNILNHQPVELFIYGYSLKRGMKKTKRSWRKHPFLDGFICRYDRKKHRRRDAKISVESMLYTTFACGVCCRSEDMVVRRDQTWVARKPS